MQDKKSKILVVDDEPDIADTLRHFLSAKGYDVISALSGEEALHILSEEKVDLILLDIMMPGIKGTEVAKIIKERYPHIKIIIVTGYSDEAEGLSKVHLLDGIFIKPVHIQELYNKLMETLSKKEAGAVALKSMQGIKARVILIKAKLLFIEPLQEAFEFLNTRFKELSRKGEEYGLDRASNEKEIAEKVKSFNPDMLIVNTSFFKAGDIKVFSEILDKASQPREIIVYNMDGISDIDNIGLERLIKAVETTCIKNGLIEIKWVEI
jgi:DNA-binding response OmpR family regulator